MMNKDDIDDYKNKLIDNYIKSIKECIKKNTNSLVMVDIISIIEKPPLDSMDVIKNKFLELAKRNKVIINIDIISSLLESYRNNLATCCDDIISYRDEYLFSLVSAHHFEGSSIFTFYKKDFLSLDKTIRMKVKDCIILANDSLFDNSFSSVFKDTVDIELQNKYINELSKFLNTNYKKSILENLDMKLMVKDTTLINIIKEQSDRYLFTLNNSHLLNDFN